MLRAAAAPGIGCDNILTEKSGALFSSFQRFNIWRELSVELLSTSMTDIGRADCLAIESRVL